MVLEMASLGSFLVCFETNAYRNEIKRNSSKYALDCRAVISIWLTVDDFSRMLDVLTKYETILNNV